MTEAEYQKVCFKCRELKPLSAFYKHPRMADGHVGSRHDNVKRTIETLAKKSVISLTQTEGVKV